ncbi:MAG TPA: PEP-CTERM system histidine kinase PrsK [Thiotrichales bacterium]|nr:PEP-CTERM system histidine kinase PrsK [Thiotrichales bacterium]
MKDAVFSIGVASYAAGLIAFLALLAVLLTGWRGRLQGGLLVLAVSGSALWALVLLLGAAFPGFPPWLLQVAESLRFSAWFAFLAGLIRGRDGVHFSGGRLLQVLFHGLALGLVLLPWLPAVLTSLLPSKSLYIGYLLLAVLSLWVVENLFRNVRSEARWGIKYLCIGLGGMFAYDFFLYSHAVLFGVLDAMFWDARGAVNALVVPLIAVAAARNPDWSLDVFVSRRMVFHMASLSGAGAYLLLMAAAGYYIRVFGGEWGGVLQILFLFAALLLLVALFFSGHLRARLKVFLSKHFFNYRYDYREEWLNFTRTLAGCRRESDPRVCVLAAVARIVDAGAGILWLRRDDRYVPIAHWNASIPVQAEEPPDGPLALFLAEKGWVVDLRELAQSPERYSGLGLPEWLKQQDAAWLVVPLLDAGELLGFMVLLEPLAPLEIDWEVLDLLKTAAVQAASYLGQLEALEALAEARQFEGFNRLSAFIMHDLKNIIAQQSIIVRNAARHRQNPAFIDDALGIMEHSVAKMSRLLELLRSGPGDVRPTELDLGRLLEEIVEERSVEAPAPAFSNEAGSVLLYADRDRLRAALRNLVHNAQQATHSVDREGRVTVRMEREGESVRILVEDNGCGMEESFIRDRLFRPFDTTKGDTGMGIGAYESRAYVRSLGGDVQVWSQPGKGSRFEVLLPVPEMGDNASVVEKGEGA